MDTTTHLIFDAFSIICGGLAGGLLAWLFDRRRAKFYRERDAVYAKQRREIRDTKAKLKASEQALAEKARETHLVAHTAVELADTDPNVRLQRMVDEWRMPEPEADDAPTQIQKAVR